MNGHLIIYESSSVGGCYSYAIEIFKEFNKYQDLRISLILPRGADFSKSRRPGQEQKRVNVDFPVWMIQSLDREAKRLGVPRQSVIKVWIAERLERVHA